MSTSTSTLFKETDYYPNRTDADLSVTTVFNGTSLTYFVVEGYPVPKKSQQKRKHTEKVLKKMGR